MEYVHSALLLHAAGQDVNEENVSDVLEAAGVEVDSAQVKSLVAALDGVDMEEAMNTAVAGGAAAPAPAADGSDESADDAEDASDDGGDEAEDAGGDADEDEEGLGGLF
ncbi:MAG: 50S ribosomal protein P1 [Candidatus Nanohaloarchaeota archaeon QJJ-5]|nr:50S ribosomal protein P1 [Candidatus Nanohaloarchaeota archaeon QJJ-5]